jgi:hypothetical protein
MFPTVVAVYGGDLEGFRECIEAQERLAAQAGFDRMKALSGMQRAEWALAAGAYAEALVLGEKAIAGYRALGSPFGLANSLATYCDAHLLSGSGDRIPALLLEAIVTALPNGLACWSFDALALYAAQGGRASEAALALGFADARYRDIEEIRRPWDRQVERRALELLADLPPADLAARRAEGARLAADEAETLARNVLGFQDISARGAAAGVQPVESKQPEVTP